MKLNFTFKKWHSLILLLFILGFSNQASAATYYARASGPWNDLNTWSTSSSTGSAASTLPTASDIVSIVSASTKLRSVSIPTLYNAVCSSLTIGGFAGAGNQGILTIADTGTLTCSGALAVNAYGALSTSGAVVGTTTINSVTVPSITITGTSLTVASNGTFTAAGNGTLNFSGALGVTGNTSISGATYCTTVTVATGTLSIQAIAKLNCSSIALNSGYITFITGTPVSNEIICSGLITVGSASKGTLTMVSSAKVTCAKLAMGSGTGSNTSLILGRNTLCTFEFTGNDTTNGVVIPVLPVFTTSPATDPSISYVFNTVIFNPGTGKTITIQANFCAQSINVISGTTSFAGNWNIDYNQTGLEDGQSLLAIAANTTLQIGGTSKLPKFASYDFKPTSTIEYVGTQQNITSPTVGYKNLVLSGTGIKKLDASVSIFVSLIVNSGVILDLNNKNLILNSRYSYGTSVSSYGSIRSSASSNITYAGDANSSMKFDQTTPGTTNIVNNFIVGSTTYSATSESPLNVIIDNPLNIKNTVYFNQGHLVSNGNVTFKSNALTTAFVGKISNTDICGIIGNVIIERFIPAARAYRPLSPSVNGGSIFNNWQGGGLITILNGSILGNTLTTTVNLPLSGKHISGNNIPAHTIVTDISDAANGNYGLTTYQTDSARAHSALNNISQMAEAKFTASVINNVLDVTAITSGSLQIGQIITNILPKVAPNTVIINQIDGEPGGIGTYTIGIADSSLNFTGTQIDNVLRPLIAYNSITDLTVAAKFKAKVVIENILNVTVMQSGSLAVGQKIVGILPKVANTVILNQLTGVTGGVGTYTIGVVDVSVNIPSGTSISYNGEAAGSGTHISGAVGSDAQIGLVNDDGLDYTRSGQASMFSYNNDTNIYSPVSNTKTESLVAGKPYMIAIRGDRSRDLGLNSTPENDTTLKSTGTIVAGDVEITTTTNSNDLNDTNGSPKLNGTEGSLNFIGNPYQAPLDLSKVYAEGRMVDLGQSYTVFDTKANTRGAFVSYDFTLPGITTILEGEFTSAADGTIEPNQAFFVTTGATTTGASLKFTEVDKVTTDNTYVPMFRKAQNTTSLIRGSVFNTSTNKGLDGFILAFSDDYSNDIVSEDTTKPTGNEDETFASTNGSKNMAIDKRKNPSENDVIGLNLTQERLSEYTLKFKVSNFDAKDAYLRDAYTAKETALKNNQTSSYAFKIDATPASTAADRFSIVFKTATALSTISNSINKFTVYPNPVVDNKFTVRTNQDLSGKKASLNIVNTLGQKVYGTNANFSNDGTITVNPANALSKGIYFLKVAVDGKVETKKLIVK